MNGRTTRGACLSGALLVLLVSLYFFLSYDGRRPATTLLPPPPQTIGQKASDQPPGYCGIIALFKAMKALGKETRFGDLVKPKYLSSPQGSTLEDLARAAEDQGLFAYPLRGLSAEALTGLSRPVLLHVKSSAGAPNYHHWVLYMGCDEDGVIIYDGLTQQVSLDLPYLAAIWDGAALVLSDQPVSLSFAYLASWLGSCWCLGLVAVCAALVYSAKLAWFPVRNIFLDVLHLALIAAAAALGALLLQGPGSLSSGPAIAEIKEAHYAGFLVEVSAAKLDAFKNAPGLRVIDTRLKRDFEAGHIEGAINLPVDASPAMFQEAVQELQGAETLILYCQNRACPYSGRVAKRLRDAGFEELWLYKGGWHDWESQGKTSQ